MAERPEQGRARGCDGSRRRAGGRGDDRGPRLARVFHLLCRDHREPLADHRLAVLVGHRVRAEADDQHLVARDQPFAAGLGMPDLGDLDLGRPGRGPAGLIRSAGGRLGGLRRVALAGVLGVVGAAIRSDVRLERCLVGLGVPGPGVSRRRAGVITAFADVCHFRRGCGRAGGLARAS